MAKFMQSFSPDRASAPHAAMNDRALHRHVQAIGLDLGGTKLYGGTTSVAGALGRDETRPTCTTSEAALFSQIVDLVETLRDDRPGLSVVLGVPGAVDRGTGTIDLSPNVPFTRDRPLGADLSAALGTSVLLENDVNLAALGESRLGAGRDLGLVCFLSFGTGVGLGLVQDGRILSGAKGRAGEVSFLPMGADPFEAARRSEAGQFEDLVGTAAIRRRYGQDAPDVRTIFARAEAGDHRAAAAVDEAAAAAACGLVSVQLVLDPDLIVVGGGIGVQKRFFDQLSRNAEKLLRFPVMVKPAELGAAAGMLGALVLAADRAGLAAERLAPATAPFPAGETPSNPSEDAL